MHLLFDLDGTLTDSSPGIVGCLNHAVVSFGLPAISENGLRPMIGAPLSTIFRRILGSEDIATIDAAVELYRQRFNAIGIFENSVYPGVVDALTTFDAAGHRMQVVTAKPAIAARRVLEHFGLARFFAAVHGLGLTDRTCDKGALVAAALTGLHGHARPIVMVGDRADDIVAARRNGVRCVAAGWGYGTRDELLAASPDYFAPAVADAVAWLQTLGRQPGQRTIWRPDAGAGTRMLDV